MSTSRCGLVVMMALGLAGGRAALAAELGDSAKPLKVGEWVKGKEIELSEGKGKNVYVVEFWATWCGPCRASIPHLTELQTTYKAKDVVVVGVSVDQDTSKVKPFVKEQGEKMNYTVAVDDAGGTSAGYMQAFGIGGIPTAFIVDKAGKIAWYGSPFDTALEKILDAVIAGKYDIQAARKARELLPKYFDLASKKRFEKTSAKFGDEIMQGCSTDASLMRDFASRILNDKDIVTRDYSLAKRAAKAAYDGCNGKDATIAALYAQTLYEAGDAAEAVKVQQKAVELCGAGEERTAFETKLKEYQTKAKQ
ncbi:MAG TPA: TlpA disulfide reductase family protein [Phycisphaerae bacterium]